jgi:hypothetical protein
MTEDITMMEGRIGMGGMIGTEDMKDDIRI